MTKFYIDYPHHVSITNEFVLDSKLSNNSKIIILCARVIGDIQHNIEILRKVSNLSKPTFYKCLDELFINGYLNKRCNERFKGKFTNNVYEFSMVSKFKADVVLNDEDFTEEELKAREETNKIIDFLRLKWSK